MPPPIARPLCTEYRAHLVLPLPEMCWHHLSVHDGPPVGPLGPSCREKSRGNQVLDRLAKEVGNSAYGKIAQAVASQRSIPDDVDSRRVFDVELGTMRELG